MPFISNSDEDRRQMLNTLGVSAIEDLVSGIPKEFIIQEDWKLHPGKSEHSTFKYLSEIASKNVSDYTSYLGGGAYDHFIPAAVNNIASRSEFSTAYTPYQPEVSQGTLQTIYEYQTMICELTGMDVSNASMYDGVSAAAEAVLLTTQYVNKNKILIPENLPDNYKRILSTYCSGRKVGIEQVPCQDGTIDRDALKRQMADSSAGLLVQYPNYFGIIEPLKELTEIVHEAGGLMICAVNPIACALLKTPGECGVDIVTGEGQALGNNLSWGGPYLGIFAVTEKLIRKIPGRLAGRTTDMQGRQGFVLTLQTREQHIRRAKATSNICTNQGLLALRACIYMSLMGKEGIREVANQCVQKAHYLADSISNIPDFSLAYDKPYFHEFVVNCPEPANQICKEMLKHNIFAGISLESMGYPYHLLVAVTEKRTKDEMDAFVEKLKKFAPVEQAETV